VPKIVDTVYTERYMKTPNINPLGYVKSEVTNMTGFKNAMFLLIHGTADGE
jgi:dipeptidyl aminopeptidase B